MIKIIIHILKFDGTGLENNFVAMKVSNLSLKIEFLR